MSQASPTWGTPRIIGELKKIGKSVRKAIVDRYRIKRKGSTSPTWKAFLTNEVKGMASIDLFAVPTATSNGHFQTLKALLTQGLNILPKQKLPPSEKRTQSQEKF